MYEYTREKYIYYGNKECGSPVREVRTVSQKEADYWDRLDKACRQVSKRQKRQLAAGGKPSAISRINKRKGGNRNMLTIRDLKDIIEECEDLDKEIVLEIVYRDGRSTTAVCDEAFETTSNHLLLQGAIIQ